MTFERSQDDLKPDCESPRPPTPTAWWEAFRLALLAALAAGGVVAVVLLVQSGTSETAQGAVAFTCLCTAASVWLFGSKGPSQQDVRHKVPTPVDRRWAVVRLVLGQAQMAGALVAAFLLLQRGLSPLSLGVVVGTCLCTGLSVLLFGGRT